MLSIHSPKELACYVISQRKKLNLSQSDVAQKIGLRQQTVSAFENKPEKSKLVTVFLILSAVQLDMSTLEKNKSLHDKTQWSEEW